MHCGLFPHFAAQASKHFPAVTSTGGVPQQHHNRCLPDAYNIIRRGGPYELLIPFLRAGLFLPAGIQLLALPSGSMRLPGGGLRHLPPLPPDSLLPGPRRHLPLAGGLCSTRAGALKHGGLTTTTYMRCILLLLCALPCISQARHYTQPLQTSCLPRDTATTTPARVVHANTVWLPYNRIAAPCSDTLPRHSIVLLNAYAAPNDNAPPASLDGAGADKARWTFRPAYPTHGADLRAFAVSATCAHLLLPLRITPLVQTRASYHLEQVPVTLPPPNTTPANLALYIAPSILHSSLTIACISPLRLALMLSYHL